MNRIYLDYAASTPVLKEVLDFMKPYFLLKYGNAGSLHSFGQEAIKALDLSRATIAKCINADFEEIIFTSSATEANNIALRGVVKKFRRENKNRPKIIISSIEHESIIQTALDLERDNINIAFIPVNKDGKIIFDNILKELDKNTILISIMYVNNETGTLQEIKKISKIIQDFKNKTNSPYPLFHSDAAQAFMYFDCDVKNLGVDLMTLSSQKIYGPKGAGVLYINSNLKKLLEPLITGGGQEFKMRSGTENIPAIVGMGKAAQIAYENRTKNKKYVQNIKEYFWRKIKKIYKRASINGLSEAPHILNVNLKEETTIDFLITLDMLGIAASSGSACQARAYEPSYVLKSMGMRQEDIRSSLRFSFGIKTTKKEIDEAIKRLKSWKSKKLRGA